MKLIIVITLLICCHGNALGNSLGNALGNVADAAELENHVRSKREAPQFETIYDHIYGAPLKIGAFNIKVFGTTKASKPDVMDSIVQILVRYDVVLVQEIRDASGEAIIQLLTQLNNVSVPVGAYQMALSERLGRTNSKEQYAFFYRSDKVSLVDDLQYDDVNDWFERPPYVVRFSSSLTEVGDFAMIGCHIKPDDAAQEMDHLVDVYEAVVNTWVMQDVMLLGDFNAACTYIDESDWDTVRLRSDSRFTWVITDDKDTTVAQASCAYDRIIVSGPSLSHNVLYDSAGAYRYDSALGLTYDQAVDVSDHYPVEVDLVGKVSEPVRSHLKSMQELRLESTQPFPVEELYSLQSFISGLGFEVTFVDNGVLFTKHGVADVVVLLQNVQTQHPQLMSTETIQLMRLHLDSGLLDVARLPGSVTSSPGNDVILSYDVSEQRFTVTVSQQIF